MQSFGSATDWQSMRQPPAPNTKAKTGVGRSGLTKSLLEQHEAFQEIDPADDDQRRQFVRERERKVRCNLTYNLKAIWTHRP